MSNQDDHSRAEFIDRFMHRTAIGVLLIALAYASSAMAPFLSEAAGSYLDNLELGLRVLAVIIILPQFIKMIRLRARQPENCETDGFVVDVYKRAASMAFALTFVTLVVMQALAGRELADLSAAFYINSTLAISLGVFSITFLRLAHAGDGEDDDDFDTGSGT